MKNVGSVKEDLNIEKRISITPETVKKFTRLGFIVNLEKNYAEHIGINDEEYKNSGANLISSKEGVLEKSDIILKVNCPSKDEVNLIKNKSVVVGQFDLNNNKDIINKLIQKDVKFFSLNLLPRITRAVAGYAKYGNLPSPFSCLGLIQGITNSRQLLAAKTIV